MMYMLTDKLINGYCYGQYPSLELARREAPKFPDAVHIVEHKRTSKPKGWLPTGVSYPVSAESEKGEKE